MLTDIDMTYISRATAAATLHCRLGGFSAAIEGLSWQRPWFDLHSKTMSAVVIAGVVVNILSVVGIVITNKYITEVDGFHFMVFLSFLHFAFTTLGTRVMLWLNIFSYQPAPLSGILPVAVGSLLSVAFMNLNLSYNSVGFYQVSISAFKPTHLMLTTSLFLTFQLSKLACIPFTLLVQYLAYKQSVPRLVQLTLIPITFGVGFATVYDLSLNVVGLGTRLSFNFDPYDNPRCGRRAACNSLTY